ncbi:chitobiase/beta-hexosaminidase C-terminal domain-containing protein [Cohnella faecalis]|nr:chitobiase/beta-hexosaminidase C-terminal domain-containing protein [Cohnella faecalis]
MKRKLSGLALAVLVGFNAAACYPNTAAAKTSADFTDLKDLDAATKAKFDALISAGVFDGVSDTKFGLKDEMNRAQFAKVAALITGIEVNKDLKTSSFSDVQADDAANGYALPYIEALKTAGITAGYGEGTYNPAGKVTKEQLAAFLVRVLGKDADAKAMTGDDTTVSNWAQGYVAAALELKLLDNGADGKFGGKANATRDLLLTGAYEAKQQYVPPGKVSVAGATQVGVRKISVSFNKAVDSSQITLSVKKGGSAAGGANVAWAADYRSATLTFNEDLKEEQIEIAVTGFDPSVWERTSATVTATPEKIVKIEFTSAGDTIARARAVAIPFKATNQFGETPQDSTKFKFSVSSGVSATIASNTMAVEVNTLSKETGDRISVSVTEQVSGVQVTRVYTVGAASEEPPVIISTPSAVAKPTADVASGAVAIGTSVTLSAASGATIYYTTDGSTPSASGGTEYNEPIPVTHAMTIKAIAVKSGMTNSGVLTLSYTILSQTETPTANVASGAVAIGTSVTLSAASGATIYYTTDGSTPSASGGTEYNEPIPVTHAMTIKAIAVKSGMTNSNVLTLSYTILLQAAMPTADVASGEIGYGTYVHLSAASGATIRYTLNGSTPTDEIMDMNSFTYNEGSPIYVVNNMTLKAVAFQAGVAASEVLTLNYTINPNAQPIAVTGLTYIGESEEKSLLKVTFSKAVASTSAAESANYEVWQGMGISMMPVSVISATRGGVGHENEVTLEVDSLTGLGPGTPIRVVVSSVQSADDSSDTIQNGNHTSEFYWSYD